MLLFGGVDVVLTLLGFRMGNVAEVHPVVAFVVSRFGPAAVVPLKAGALVAFYGLYRAVPDDIRVGVPVGLTVLGASVAGWNGYVLLRAAI